MITNLFKRNYESAIPDITLQGKNEKISLSFSISNNPGYVNVVLKSGNNINEIQVFILDFAIFCSDIRNHLEIIRDDYDKRTLLRDIFIKIHSSSINKINNWSFKISYTDHKFFLNIEDKLGLYTFELELSNKTFELINSNTDDKEIKTYISHCIASSISIELNHLEPEDLIGLANYIDSKLSISKDAFNEIYNLI